MSITEDYTNSNTAIKTEKKEKIEDKVLDMTSNFSTTSSSMSRKRKRGEYSSDDPFSGFIEFNVGGTVFNTRRETLCEGGRTLFKTLFERLNDETDTERDLEGRIFVDRDPEIFKIVLSYLRTGILRIPKPSLRYEVEEQFSFFGIDAPECFTKGPHMVTICWNSKMPTGKKMEIDPEEASELFTGNILEGRTLPEAVRAFCTIGFELKQFEVSPIETVFLLTRVVYR